MNHFTPWSALAGGALIGLAAAILWLFRGKVAGISGILGGVLTERDGKRAWRFAFLAGLIGAPFVYALIAPLPAMQIDADTPSLIIAGLLVGFGTRYGNGCTSGHGVCGTARWSTRSLAATACFMAAGFLTVYVLRHVW